MPKNQKNNFSNNFFKIIIFSVFFLTSFIFYARAEAASILFSPNTGSYEAGDTIQIKAYVNTEGVSVNAISGSVNFSKDTLKLTSISKFGSVITLWAQEPSYSNASGIASFEGVILNGYKGSAGTALTFAFKILKAGTATLKFSNASVLANDGEGTNVLSNRGSANFNISALTKHLIKEPVKAIVKNVKKSVPEVAKEEPKKIMPIEIPPKIVVADEGLWGDLINSISKVIPVSILVEIVLLVCLFISIYVLFKMYYFKLKIRSKLHKAESMISKSFEALEDDVEEADKTLRKEFRKDIHEAEKIIMKELKDLE